MPETLIQRKFLLLLSTMVMTLGALTTWTLLEPPRPGAISDTSEYRTPANVIPTHAPLMNEVKLDCDSRRDEKIFGLANQVRLQGHFCSRDGQSYKLTAAVNLTNGFAATLFATSETEFTSDFMSLQSGENQILLTETGPRGESRKRTVTLVH